jgi:hypothetical protein
MYHSFLGVTRTCDQACNQADLNVMFHVSLGGTGHGREPGGHTYRFEAEATEQVSSEPAGHIHTLYRRLLLLGYSLGSLNISRPPANARA